MDNWRERVVRHWLVIVLGLTGFVLLLYGLMSFVAPPQAKSEIVFNSADSPQSQDPTLSEKKLMVDVQGAVEKPGVYQFANDSRVQDVLTAAGGMSKEADLQKIAKTLNLAAKVTDGAKIYIPFVGEATSVGRGEHVLGLQAVSEVININTASANELDKLQGVGQVTAEKIITNRPYSTIEELVQKKVVSQKVFETIKEKISIY